MKKNLWLALTAGFIASTVFAVPAIDGVADDAEYGVAQDIQFNETQFGDTRSESVNFGAGSQIDGLFAYQDATDLYLTFAGNLESNGNRLVIFIDSVAGGQNQLAANNPNLGLNDYLNRMGEDIADPNFPGLKFSAGFEADYVVSVALDGERPVAFVDFAEIFNADPNLNLGFFVGEFGSRCTTMGGAVDPNTGDLGAPGILLAYDNSNEVGVSSAGGGAGIDINGGFANILGVEMLIPLGAIGAPSSVDIVAGIVSNDGAFFSNQFVGSLTDGIAAASANLEESRVIDLGAVGSHTPITIGSGGAAVTYGGCILSSGNCQIMDSTECGFIGGTFDPNGCPDRCLETAACCTEGLCTLETEVDCIAGDGLFFSSQPDCSLNPCDPNELWMVGGFTNWDATFDIMPRIAPKVFEYTIDPNGADPNTRYQFQVQRIQGDWDSKFFTSDHWLYTDLGATNTITFDTNIINDGWLPDINRMAVSHHDPVPWTVTGDHLAALGGGNWDNQSPEGAMDGDPNTGQFTYSVDLPTGSYNWKPVQTGSWDSVAADTRSVNTDNVTTDLDPNLADPNGFVTLTVELDVPGGRVRISQSTPASGSFVKGDINCSGGVDAFDIEPFILALLDPAQYAIDFPACDLSTADINGVDGVNSFDIEPFIGCVLNAGCP